jgi:hypothetical protein
MNVSKSRSGGIGRRAGFKIQFWQRSAGSIPAFGTCKNPHCENGGDFFIVKWIRIVLIFNPTANSLQNSTVQKLPFLSYQNAD